MTETIDVTNAKAIFIRTVENLGFTNIEALWEGLVQKYAEEYRSYHNIQHIQEVAEYLDKNYPFPETKDLILFAGFFHDIYNTKDPLAEELSAVVASGAYLEVGDSEGKLEADQFVRNASFIHRAIMATKTHDTDVVEFQYLVDADLERFKAEDNRFADQIREEYREHSDEAFNAGRPVVLKRFLAREPFFYHGTVADDELAYKNIQRQLDEL